MKNARKFNWTDYFEEKDKVTQTNDVTALYNTTGSKSYYVYFCIFDECKSKSAIYIKRDNEICTLLEDNKFTRCKSTSEGGSVYYDCHQSGQFVQQRNSYSESIASDYMSFYQWVKYSPDYKNYAFQISVSKCGESESEGWYAFDIAWGDLRFENNNITYNKCTAGSSIHSILDGKSSTCNFSTFKENNQGGSPSLEFWSNNDSYIQTVSYCNVIGNKCGTDNDQVLFRCNYNTNVDHCVFLNNTPVYMFDISYKGYTLTITDSCIESNSISTGGTVTFEREDQIYSDIYQIPSFYTEFCFMTQKPKKSQFYYLIYPNLQENLLACFIVPKDKDKNEDEKYRQKNI